jgi:DNA-binding transcriptional LysR family regulator
MLDLRQLDCFLAVADELHFGRAAARLHLAQPSVSEHVRRLEQLVGGELFTRTSRSVRLTALGEVFLPEARRARDQLDHALNIARQAARDGATPLLVGTAVDVGQDLLAAVLPALRASHPDLAVRTRPLRTIEQIEALLDRQIHVGLGWEPPDHPELSQRVISVEPYLAVVPDGHPLAARERVTLAEIAEHPIVMWSRDLNHWVYDAFIAVCRDADVSLRIVDEAWGIDNQLPLILAGIGIGVTAASIASLKSMVGLALVPLDSGGRGTRRAAMWRNDERHPGVPLLVDALSAAAAT